jgi:hypothetical protein
MNLGVVGIDEPAFAPAWQGLAGRQVVRSALYTPTSLEYYREQRQLEEIGDLSFVVVLRDRGLVGVKMQAFRHPAGTVEVSCHGLPCLFGEAGDTTAEERDAGHRAFKSALNERLASLRHVDELRFRDHLDDSALSHMGHILLGLGARARIVLTQVIDLSVPEAQLRAPFGKTVRWSINWGVKNLEIAVRDAQSVAPADIEAFRDLHVEAAGRETRSRLTWERQLEMVRAGAAFIVLGWLGGELVTAAFFINAAEHCYYGVSASRRQLFGKPLGHAIIWTAMLHARNVLGIRLFEMGEQSYPGLAAEPPSDKERGIAFFKRSFGGQSEACLDIVLTDSNFGSAEAAAP